MRWMAGLLLMGLATSCASDDDNSSCEKCDQLGATESSRGAFLWQGMDHQWLREVAGFRTPHRISRLASEITDERHDDEGGTWSARATFGMAQNTGVDGNFMRPLGFFSALYAPDLLVAHGTERLAWSDQIAGSDTPQARSEIRRTLEINLDTSELGRGAGDTYAAVLRGFSLATKCEDASQPPDEPCNSDGLWPYRFSISIGECTREEQRLSCPLEVDIFRAWTPNQGGLPGIATKPLNRTLDFDLDVHYTVFGGTDAALRVQYNDDIEGMGTGGVLEPQEPFVAQRVERGAGGERYPVGELAITGFAFELFQNTGDQDDRFRHLGRYVLGLSLGVLMDEYDPKSGEMSFTADAHVLLPNSVEPTGTRYRISTAMLQLGHADAQISRPGTAESSLCINSSDQAPLFSHWMKCGDKKRGPERSSTEETIRVTPE